MSSNALSDEIGRVLLCNCQALLKTDDDPDINYVRLGLGHYVMELHQAEHVIPEKRIQLMLEVLYCTDRDNLSKNQFFEAVQNIKSSDEVRHWLIGVKTYLNKTEGQGGGMQVQTINTYKPVTKIHGETASRLEDNRNETYRNYASAASEHPTFEDQYPNMQNKRFKLSRKEWNFEKFLNKLINDFYDFDNGMDILEVTKDKDIIYITEERPEDERSLVEDLKTIFSSDNFRDIPLGTLLLLLERILNVFDYEDKQTMPQELQDRIVNLIRDYPKFNNHLIYE